MTSRANACNLSESLFCVFNLSPPNDSQGLARSRSLRPLNNSHAVSSVVLFNLQSLAVQSIVPRTSIEYEALKTTLAKAKMLGKPCLAALWTDGCVGFVEPVNEAELTVSNDVLIRGYRAAYARATRFPLCYVRGSK